MSKLISAFAIAAIAASPVWAAAQQPRRPMDMQNQAATACSMAMHAMMMGDMGGGMMRLGPGPADSMMKGRMGERMNDSSMMMQMQSELGLSDAQLQQLRAIHQHACTAAQPHMRMAMDARQAAMQAIQGDNPSLDHFEDQLDKAAKHMVAAEVEMAKGMIDIRKALSPAQRQKLDQMHQKMQDEMRSGGTPGRTPDHR